MAFFLAGILLDDGGHALLRFGEVEGECFAKFWAQFGNLKAGGSAAVHDDDASGINFRNFGVLIV